MSDNKSFKVQNGLDVTGDANVSGSVTATSFIGDGSQLTGISGGGSGGGLDGFDVSTYDDATSNGIFSYNVSPGNQIRHLYSLNDAVAPTAYDGSVDYQVSWTMSSNQQFGFRDAGGTRTKVNARANGTTASTGLVLEGETFNNSGVELVGNVKLSSLPTSDPSEAGLLWNDGGIPVFSGSTAPAGGSGGGLDSAEVISTINDEFKVSSSKVEIGQSANASGLYGLALGFGATASGTASYAIGDATASSSNALAIVDNAVASAVYAIAIGQRAEATHINTIALGNEADAKGNYGIAIGDNAAATAANTLAMGKSASATAQYGIDIRTSAAGSLTYDTTNDWVFGSSVTLPGATISGHIIPDANAQYDLGAAEYKFRHLYLSENSVHTPHGALSFVDGNLTFGGEPVMLLSDIQEVAAECDTFEDFKAALASL